MSLPPPELARLAIIGGTGPEGRGLALRFAQAGFAVSLGSRAAERGKQTARELVTTLGRDTVNGSDNLEAASTGDIVVLTIPYAGIPETLPPLEKALAGKIVVSAVAPIEFRDGRPVGVHPAAGSAAEEVQHLLPSSRVVSAFQTIDAQQLGSLDSDLDTDVIVCSDDVEARREIVRLASLLPGARALSGGRLSTSRYVEQCTVLLIIMNRIYKSHSGLRITNINR